MWPVPLQRGQVMWLPSLSAGRRRWRLSSSRPNLLIELNCTRARSWRSASRRRCSTSRRFLRLLHVDEVDDDQAAQVAQPHLARDLVGGFEVGAGGGFLDVAAARGARRVDVDRDQRLGVVDHDRAAGRQVHRARERGLDLVLDLEAAEQRRVVAVALDRDAVSGITWFMNCCA